MSASINDASVCSRINDRQKLLCHTVVEAKTAIFASHWVFSIGIQFPKKKWKVNAIYCMFIGDSDSDSDSDSEFLFLAHQSNV